MRLWCGAFSLQNVDLAGACVENTSSSSRECFKYALDSNRLSSLERVSSCDCRKYTSFAHLDV